MSKMETRPPPKAAVSGAPLW